MFPYCVCIPTYLILYEYTSCTYRKCSNNNMFLVFSIQCRCQLPPPKKKQKKKLGYDAQLLGGTQIDLCPYYCRRCWHSNKILFENWLFSPFGGYHYGLVGNEKLLANKLIVNCGVHTRWIIIINGFYRNIYKLWGR